MHDGLIQHMSHIGNGNTVMAVSELVMASTQACDVSTIASL